MNQVYRFLSSPKKHIIKRIIIKMVFIKSIKYHEIFFVSKSHVNSKCNINMHTTYTRMILEKFLDDMI